MAQPQPTPPIKAPQFARVLLAEPPAKAGGFVTGPGRERETEYGLGHRISVHGPGIIGHNWEEHAN